MFTAEQRDEFYRLGVVPLRGAIPRADAEAMCQRVWQALGKRHGVCCEIPATWKSQYLIGFNHLPKSESFSEIGSPAVRAALDDLLGFGKWQPPNRWGSLLMSFPNSPERWTVPHQAWHLDYPVSASEMNELFIVRIFLCLEKIESCAGGTLFVAGSHRLLENLVSKIGIARMRSAQARMALIRTCPWIKSLCTMDEDVDRIEVFMMRSSVVNGIEVRVVEMTGEPGDVFLMHPILLHAPSKNTAAVPRIALSSTIHRAAAFKDETN